LLEQFHNIFKGKRLWINGRFLEYEPLEDVLSG